MKLLAQRLSLWGLLATAWAPGCGDSAAPAPDPTSDPGRVTLHRLNRTEYNNTVRDLLGTARTPADEFPYDDIGHGFDNNADVLSLSPLQVELYQRAAEALVAEALRTATPSSTKEYNADAFPAQTGLYRRGTYLLLASNIEVPVRHTFSDTARYRFSLRAYGEQAGADPPRMALLIDGVARQTFNVTATQQAPAVYEVTLDVSAGARQVAIAFTNDFYDANNKLDRNLAVEWLRIEGPQGLMTKNPLRDRIVTCDPRDRGEASCAQEILARFARRAFRRPVGQEEIAPLLAFLDVAKAQGEGFDRGIALALQAILVSPHFLFRVELDPDPQRGAPHRLSDHELASRLSYFLWSTMPDDDLLALADAGKLQDDEVLRGQVARMLADPKAAALVDHFAGQWLYQRALLDHKPSYASFPGWSEELRQALMTETRLFLKDLLGGDRPLGELLTADYTYANDKVAKHYGLKGTFGAMFQRVSLSGTQRRGILTQGSLLTVTSYPTRTSPVKRGKWVMEQLLCSGPPAPPPGVEGLVDQPMPTGTLRQRLEEHRKNPQCAVCHNLMDPIGFGLENFDGIGAYRTKDGPGAVDSSGELPDGRRFSGAGELSGILAQDARFERCLVEKTFTYALGRAPVAGEEERLRALTAQLKEEGLRFRDLVLRLTQTEFFRSRRGEPAGGAQL
jgi:hypothetical protein